MKRITSQASRSEGSDVGQEHRAALEAGQAADREDYRRRIELVRRVRHRVGWTLATLYGAGLVAAYWGLGYFAWIQSDLKVQAYLGFLLYGLIFGAVPIFMGTVRLYEAISARLVLAQARRLGLDVEHFAAPVSGRAPR